MNNTWKLIYTPEALNDLRSIFIYIAFVLKVSDTAQKQVNRIRKEIRSLSTLPERYALVEWEPWKSRNTRKITVDNYVVYYRVADSTKEVIIIRIFYGGQDIKNILG